MDSKKYKEIEKASRIYLDFKQPLVIRLDGKNVTKNKKEYDLTVKEGYLITLQRTVASTMRSFYCEAMLYSIMDEISIIIYEPELFFNNFDDTNQLYCAGIFLQRFLLFFRKFLPTEFGISMFNLSEDDIYGYLEWRKGYGRASAAVYVAKKFGIDFYGKETEELIKEISNSFPLWYSSHQWFFEGVFDKNTEEIQEEIILE